MPKYVGQTDDGVHRSADFVAHIGQKVAFGPVGRVGPVAGFGQLCIAQLQQLFGLLVAGNVGTQNKKVLHPGVTDDR